MTISEPPALRILGGRVFSAQAGLVEDQRLHFGLGALGRDFLVVPEKRYAGGVADSYGDFAGGMDGHVGRRDEGFLADKLSVGEDGDPCVLTGADDEGHGSGRLRCGRGFRGSANGYVARCGVIDSRLLRIWSSCER